MNLAEIVERLALIRIQGSNWFGFAVFIAMNIYAGLYLVKNNNCKTKLDKFISFFGGFVVTHFFFHIYEASTVIPIWWRIRTTVQIPQLAGVWWWQWVGAEFMGSWNFRRHLRYWTLAIYFVLAGIYATIMQGWFKTTAMNSLIGWNLVLFYVYVYIPGWIVLYIVFTKGFFKRLSK